ncbi:MAG: glycerol-3-phosphate 1-O-acyltransferase PlsY [Lachnospiraceae bacterium]|nr:glycerol-3-phosphate 1-O-acyltransferase PlsY [Lachnospiraceae bacterium]
MQRIICILIGYACGLIQTGYIVARLKGIDIKQHGSKNAGTTNVLRTMGLKYGLIVFVGDVLKCGLAILITHLLFHNSYPEMLPLLKLYAAAGTILGHNYPFYLNFKGGKGIAATAGLCFFALGPIMSFLGLATFFGIFFLTHYVSLGSILVYAGIIIESLILSKNGYWGEAIATTYFAEYNLVIVFLALMAWWKHKENIKNLLRGTERKTYLRGKPEIDVDGKEQGKHG